MAESDDSTSGDNPSEQSEPVGDGEVGEPELDEALGEIEEVEAQRRWRGALIGVAVFMLLGVAIFVILRFRTTIFRPRVDLETKGETVRKTDDPQCREMIAEVKAIGHRFFALEEDIASALPGGTTSEMKSVFDDLEALSRRLEEAEKLGEEATLRYDDDRKQLDDWFDYMDYEIGILINIAERHLPASALQGADVGDAGDAGDAGSRGRDAGAADVGDEGAESDYYLRQRRKAVAAIHDAFESFRVWHTAGPHPCGEADSEETPWRPDDWGDAGHSTD